VVTPPSTQHHHGSTAASAATACCLRTCEAVTFLAEQPCYLVRHGRGAVYPQQHRRAEHQVLLGCLRLCGRLSPSRPAGGLPPAAADTCTVYYKPLIINGQLKYITLGSRELRIYNGVPGKGKETRTLGRDRRDPSGHDPPPGWVGGISESKI